MRAMPASREDRGSGQSRLVRQSSTNAASATSKPAPWALANSAEGIVGSIAPSRTSRPTLSGNRSAYVAPSSVPYDAPR